MSVGALRYGYDALSAPWRLDPPRVVTTARWYHVPPFVALADIVERAARRRRARQTHPHKRTARS